MNIPSALLKSFSILSLFVLIIFNNATGQTPGMIIKPAQAPGNTVLDPDADGYVSQKTNGVQLGFTIPPDNDVLNSEIPYVAIIRPDPLADILRGPVGAFIEIVGVDAAGNNAILTYRDATNLLIRFRLGGYAPNSKSYSLMIDTDGKFGFTGVNADPNAVTGNPGFEAEIVLETNFNVKAYNVNGTTSGTEVASYLYDTNCQKSMAVSVAGGDPDYFYDFYLPLSSLTTLFTATTPLRIVAVTVMNPHPAIGNNALSDVGGVTTGKNLDQIFQDLIDGQTPTVPGEEVLDRSACPIISAVGASSTTISGTSSEADGTTINVLVYQSNGVTLIGKGTTTVSSGAWSKAVSALFPIVTLANGQIVKATATASGKGVSYDNCSTQTVTSCSTITNVMNTGGTEISSVSGGKGFDITLFNRPIGTKVYLYSSGYTLRAVSDLKNGVTNPFTTTVANQIFSFECQTGNCFGTDVYYFRIEEPTKCISPYFSSCLYAGTASAAPTISASPITTGSTTITGTGTAASAQISVYANGTIIGSATTGATPFNWSASVSNLVVCQDITATQTIAAYCVSLPTAAVKVTRAASKPTITSTGCSALIPTAITGFSAEVDGSVINLYKTNSSGTPIGTTTVAIGAWTVSTISPALVSGDIIVAIVAAGGCLTVSADSEPVTIKTQTSNVPIITSDPVLEGATVLSGTGIVNDVITLYIGGTQAYNNSGDLITTTVNGSGNWSLSGIPASELYIGASVNVTATASGKCEGTLSGARIVQCTPPTPPIYSGGNFGYCVGNAGQMSLITSQAGVVYQLVNSSGGAEGPASIGTGSGITLYTNALTGDLLNLKVKAYKIGYNSCSAAATTLVNFTPASPTPDVTFTSTSLSVAKGTIVINLPYSAKSPVADNYTIDYSVSANNQGFTDVTTPVTITAAPGNISLTVPAAPVTGIYSGTIKIYQPGGTGCSRSYGFTVSVYDGAGAPLINTQPAGSTICSGNPSFVSVTTTNATNYQWQIASAFAGPFSNVSDGSHVTSGNTDTYTTVNLTATRYFRAVVSNVNGSVISNVAVVTVSPLPSAASVIAGDNLVCTGQGSLTYNVGSILNATTYTWDYTGSNETLTPGSNTAALGFGPTTTSGNITVYGTNSCGNGTAASLAITVNQTPAINNMAKDVCSGLPINVAPVNSTNGIVPTGTTYSWSAPVVTGGMSGGAPGTGAASITGTLTNTTTSTQTATYTVTPTANGCAGATFTVIVSVNPPINLVATPVAALCNGASTGSVNLTVTGGTPAYTYQWGDAITTQNRSALPAATYGVTVTDSEGCTATASAIVTQSDAIIITPTVTNIACNGGTTGAIDVGITGGSGTKTYLWNDGSALQNRTGLVAGTYSVTVTDANGCTKASGSITVTQQTAIGASALASEILCNGGTSTITVTASGGYGTLTYSLDGGAYQSGNIFAGKSASATPYNITVKDDNICTVNTSVTITQPSSLALTTALTNPTCPPNATITADENGAINLIVVGGTGTKTYDWNNDGYEEPDNDPEDLSSLQAGTYTVIVTDTKGCTATKTVTLTATNSNPVTPGTITK